MRAPRSTIVPPTSTRPLILRSIALLLVGAVLAACGQATDPASDAVDPAPVEEPATEEPATEEPVAEAPASEDEAVAEEPTEPEPVPVERSGALEVVIDGRELTISRADGSILHVETLPADAEVEFQTVFEDIAVRPGATATHLDAIVATTRGESPRLHHLAVRGDEVRLELVPEHLQPQNVLEAWIVLAFTPDGDSVLWTEPSSEQPVLRSFGWDDGPGTGRRADDNAAFSLDLPMDVFIDGFVVHDETTWTLLLIDGIGEPHEVAMERQADGALALPPR